MRHQDYQASWIVQKIIKAKTLFDQIWMSEAYVAAMSNYSIKKIYGLCRGDFHKAPWRRLVCNNAGLPKCIFILFLALHRRLQTKKRIAYWANIEDMECVPCEREWRYRPPIVWMWICKTNVVQTASMARYSKGGGLLAPWSNMGNWKYKRENCWTGTI